MNKIYELINLYKSDKKLFGLITVLVNACLIIWQSIFVLIVPSRGNILILFILIGALVFQLVKNP